MGDYVYVVVDASTGRNLAELPLSDVKFSVRLNDAGEFQGTIPVDHPKATRAILEGDRELTVFRRDKPVWNGPITITDAERLRGTVEITGREASWYLGKRTLEIPKTYAAADLFDVARDLITYAKTKTASTVGNLNAALYNFQVSSGLSGITKSFTLAGTARYLISDLIRDILSADPTGGLDFRMDYATGSTRTSVTRTLTLGAPLGTTRTRLLDENVLHDYGRVADRERAGTRVHARGAGGKVQTAQNVGSISAGDILLELVADRTEITDDTQLLNFVRDLRRLAQPPVRVYSTTFVPGPALPYGWCDLADLVTLNISGPGLLATNGATRRVVEIETTPPDDDEQLELVELSYNLPLDELGE